MTAEAAPSSPGTHVRLAELAGVFSLAGDLGRGQPQGHSLRTCYLAVHIAREMELRAGKQADVYYAALLVHAGCTAGASQFAAMLAGDEIAAFRDLYLCDPGNLLQVLKWLGRHTAPQAAFPTRAQRFIQALFQAERTMGELDRGCSDVGAQVAQRLGLPDGVQDGLFHICELWNGKGPHRLRGNAIPLTARIVNASMVLEVFSRVEGRREAEAAAARFRGRYFAPDVADAFLAVSRKRALWEVMGREDPWEAVMEMEPGPSPLLVGEDALDGVLTAFGDFADLKSVHTAGHSRETGRLAEAVARRMGLGPDRWRLARRAALVHHLGLVAIPSFLLDRPGPRSELEQELEQEQVKLHPYYTQHILSRVAGLETVAEVAGMHHERLDGQGYPRGLSQAGIPAAARVVAATDAYLELVHDGPGRRGAAPDEALGLMRQEAGARFDPACLDALAVEVRDKGSGSSGSRGWPGDLTGREVDVLRLVWHGVSRREVAQRLVVSEHTVRHHLESIYGKIGVSSRAGAVLFAVENGLLG